MYFSKQRHADDAISYCERPSPIIAYKPQGIHTSDCSLPDDSFVLIIVTEFQSKLFEEYSDKIVSLDSTLYIENMGHRSARSQLYSSCFVLACLLAKKCSNAVCFVIEQEGKTVESGGW